jgi:hypothetical protein
MVHEGSHVEMTLNLSPEEYVQQCIQKLYITPPSQHGILFLLSHFFFLYSNIPHIYVIYPPKASETPNASTQEICNTTATSPKPVHL